MARMTNSELNRYARSVWRTENPRLFGGRLQMPAFKIQALPEASGMWHHIGNPLRETISLDPKYCTTKIWTRIIVVHEMIHQLQAIQKSARTIAEQHGRFFQHHIVRIVATDITLFQLISTVPKWAKK